MIAPEIKERAYLIDPQCWKSYSGKATRHKQRADSRRTASLAQARKELIEDFNFAPGAEPFDVGYGITTEECVGIRGQRRYTIDEIDRMRKAILRINPYGQRFDGMKQRATVEDQLRTAMIGGVDPQELEDKADEFWARVHERREARRREQEADAARICAGGRAINVTERAEAIVADAPMNSYWRRVIASRIEAILSRIGGGKI
jgi:hypothetical protein